MPFQRQSQPSSRAGIKDTKDKDKDTKDTKDSKDKDDASPVLVLHVFVLVFVLVLCVFRVLRVFVFVLSVFNVCMGRGFGSAVAKASYPYSELQ